MSKLQLVGQANSVMVEHLVGRFNTPRLYPSWEWEGAVRTKAATPLLSKIGPGYMVKLDTGLVYTDDAERFEPMFKDEQ